MKTGVILVTLGGPRSLQEVPEFIKRFIGRELPPPALKAVIDRYRQIGGLSPLCRITEEQAKALNDALGPDYLCAPAFRYTPPFIPDALESLAAAGPARILVLLLSPYFTSVTTGNYIDVAKDYLEKRPLPMPVAFIHSWYREPLFIESWVEAIRGAAFDDGAFYLFSAHSLPMRFNGEPYRRQIEEAVELVASRAGIKTHALGWQSIPTNAAEPWITPTVEERIDAIAAAGFQRFVHVPIGFTADHIETLYDVDITHRQYALGKGLSFRRIPSLNAGPPFIQALREIVTKVNQLEVVTPADPGSPSGTGAGVQGRSSLTRMDVSGPMTKKIAIVGGGISALACAVDLKEKGVDFTLFEKEKAVGGKLYTEKIGDLIVEGGPDSYLPEKYWSVQLIKKVGLAGEMLCSNDEHKGTFIFSRGRLHPLPEGVMLMVPTMIMPLVRSRLISLPGKLRMGTELFVPPRCDLKDESLAEFVTRRLGRECLEKIAEPLVAGIHTSNPDNMSVLATFPRFVEMERTSGSLIRGMLAVMKNRPPQKPAGPPMTYFMSLKEGMQELVQGCVRYIGAERIRTGTAVRSLAKREGGYCLTFGDGTTADFAAVVLATPSFVSKEIIGAMDPELSDRLSAIAWSSSATVSIAFRKSDVGKPLPGFGFIVPRVENRRINACTWSSIKWAHRAADDTLLIRSFVGGGHHEELVSLDDGELVAIVREELREIVGLTAEPVFSKVYRWFQGMPKYTVGHQERIAAIDELRKEHRGLFLIGSSYRGIGIGDCVKSGFDAAAAISAL